MKRFLLLMSVTLMAMSMSAETYGPLLTAKWDTEAPFKNQCKFVYDGTTYSCEAGPAAIAASMVLYYWKYPAGVDALDGYSGKLGISMSSSVDYDYPELPATTFDWGLMKDDYTSGYKGSEANAVAKLVHYAGHAQQMMYGKDGSSAYPSNIVKMFVTFGYDSKTCRLVEKSDYSEEDWATLIQGEIKAGRPVVYVASNSSGAGHAFVVDGYDPSTDKYHVNLGWGEEYNDWLAMNSFGYQSGTYLYNQNQMAVVGIQPQTNSEPYAVVSSDGQTLTFYYDENKAAWLAEAGEEKVCDLPFTPGHYPATNNKNITTATFDPSFDNCHDLTTTYTMFFLMDKLTTINNIEYLHTENVTDMGGMFWGCSSLETLDLSHFDTGKVTGNGMVGMFNGCSSLETIYCAEGTDWSTNDANKAGMFSDCEKLSGKCGGKEFPFDPEKTDGTYAKMYNGTTDGGYFTSITEKPVPYAVLEGTTLTFYYDASKATWLDKVGEEKVFDVPWDLDPKNSEDDFPDWTSWGGNRTIKTVTFNESFKDYDGLKSTRYMFFGLSYLTTINNLAYLNTESVTDMCSMFNGCCYALKTLDLSKLNTANVTDMSGMFFGCSKLESLDLGDNFNTSNVITMQGMFYDCEALETLDLSNFNTAKVISMYQMFMNCVNLKTLDVSNFNTEKVTDMGDMFANCYDLETIYCAKDADWSGVNGRDYDYMFCDCMNLSGKYRSDQPFQCDGTNYIDGEYAKVCTFFQDGYFTYKGNEDYVLTVTEAGMATLYLEYDAEIPVGVEVYYCTGLDDDETVPTTETETEEAHAVKLTSIPAQTGVFVKAAEGEYVFEHIPSTVLYIKPRIEGNILEGTLKKTTVEPHSVLTLGYGNKTGDLGFWWYTGTTIPANRAYIPESALESAPGVKGITLVFDEETGIKTTNPTNPTNESWYSIDGRKLEGKPTQKGLYINNGRKVLIK